MANFYAGFAPELQSTGTSSCRAIRSGRTNLLEEAFFLTRENQTWHGVGYFVRTNYTGGTTLGFPKEGLGTLYRFETNYSEVQFRAFPFLPWLDFTAAQANDRFATKLIDNVVHFKLRAYDTNGVWINWSLGTNRYHQRLVADRAR